MHVGCGSLLPCALYCQSQQATSSIGGYRNFLIEGTIRQPRTVKLDYDVRRIIGHDGRFTKTYCRAATSRVNMLYYQRICANVPYDKTSHLLLSFGYLVSAEVFNTVTFYLDIGIREQISGFFLLLTGLQTNYRK